ncbi:MAG: thioredoxin family protein [Flavobacterium sp.]
MNNLITQAIHQSISYTDYRNLIRNLLAEGKSTGNQQSEELTKYSELNEVRMNRLDKTIFVTEEVENALNQLQGEYTWLVITEGWCGDAAQILPVLNKMVSFSSNIKMKIVLRDEHDELMNQFLTNGSKAIPKLIVIKNATQEVLAHWGPRPEGATQLIIDYKETHGIIDETAKTNLQKWYLQDKGLSIMNEVVHLMKEVETKITTEAV